MGSRRGWRWCARITKPEQEASLPRSPKVRSCCYRRRCSYCGQARKSCARVGRLSYESFDRPLRRSSIAMGMHLSPPRVMSAKTSLHRSPDHERLDAPRRQHEHTDVRHLRVVTEPLDDSADPVLALYVECPRRGQVGLEVCMECPEGGRLRHHGSNKQPTFECKLERGWREESR